MKKRCVTAILLFFLAFCITTASAENTWPFYNGNLQQTGLSPYDTSKVNGAVKWTFEAGDAIESSPTVADDGTIYFGSHDGYLYALNSDGSLKWKYKGGDIIYNDQEKHYGGIISSPAIGKEGTVYIIGTGDFLYAIKEGKEVWKFPLKWNPVLAWNSPMVGDDGVIYAGSARANLDPTSKLVSGFYAVNPDGTEKWHHEISAGVQGAPAIAKDGTIYVSGNVERKKAGEELLMSDGYLFAFSPDGTLKWKFNTRFWVEVSPSIGKDGTVYIGSRDAKLYALNPDGSVKWVFSAADISDRIEKTAAIGSDGTLYFGTAGGTFYAVNPDGTEKWRYAIENPTDETTGTSAAIGADGTTYFGTVTGRFYALNPDGTLKWKIINLNSVASCPAIGKDGTIYFGGWDNKMHAVGEGDVANQALIPEIQEDCHEKQLSRDFAPSKEVLTNCIDGTCDSTSFICLEKNIDSAKGCNSVMEACNSRNCKKIEVYCSLALRNTDSRGHTIHFNASYVTADGEKHFLGGARAFFPPGMPRTHVWKYVTTPDNLGHCEYGEPRNTICGEKKHPYDRTALQNRGKNNSKPLENLEKTGTSNKEEQAVEEKYAGADNMNSLSRLFGGLADFFRRLFT